MPNKTALINWRDDVAEENNLIKTHPEKAAELRKRFAKVIQDGRSTKGAPVKNDGREVWDQVEWINDLK